MSKQKIQSIYNILIGFLIVILLPGCDDGSPASSAALAQVGESASSVEPAPPMTGPSVARPSVQTMLPDRLAMPTINIDIPVVELGWSTTQQTDGQIFSEWDVAEYAAGWHKNSALLGEGGNVVMSGHNNILGSVFRELDQLKSGDKITVWSGSRSFEYQVDKVMIVPEKYASLAQRKDNAKWIGAFDDNRLTLVSCWPRDDNTHRIIVVAHTKG
jgi:sortase A